MEWFALLIPVIAAIMMLLLFYKKVTWWEVSLPILCSFIFIMLFKFSVKTIAVRDTEFWGSNVIEARYYEPWSTWVEATCSYCCSTDKNGSCTSTCYYDCSYCSSHSAYWKAYDDAGNSWDISESYYKYLMDKWMTTPVFNELNRSINHHGRSCGVDGDMYAIRWKHDGVLTEEAAVTEHSYTNRVQTSHSAFSLPYISKKQAKLYGLYDYPEFYNHYKQRVVLGLDSIYGKYMVDAYEQYFQYVNGYYGKSAKVKFFVCLFYDKPITIAFNQEAYWDGGNQNEVVICIGLNKKTKKIDWVRPFGWTDNKKILVNFREDISNLKYFDPQLVFRILEKNVIENKGIYKNLDKDFSYLEVELTNWQLFWLYLLTILITIGISYWDVKNDIERE